MKTNSHIQIALLSIHIILILIAIKLKSKIYFPKISLFICPFALCLILLTLSGTHFIYLFYFVLLNVSPIQIRQSGADSWSETLKVQQTAISIILNSSPFANSDTKLKFGQLLYWEPICN